MADENLQPIIGQIVQQLAAGNQNMSELIQAVGDLAPSGDVTGPATATDSAAARFDGSTGELLKDSALLVANTTGSLSRSGDGGIPIQGTNTNDSASTGYVGEVVSSSIAVGSAVSLTNATAANITSISLTAGDWDLSGQVVLVFSATPTTIIGNINTTSATLGTIGLSSPYMGLSVTFTAGFTQYLGLPTGRISLSGTTTVYLIGYGTFGAGTGSAYGWIMARRAR